MALLTCLSSKSRSRILSRVVGLYAGLRMQMQCFKELHSSHVPAQTQRTHVFLVFSGMYFIPPNTNTTASILTPLSPRFAHLFIKESIPPPPHASCTHSHYPHISRSHPHFPPLYTFMRSTRSPRAPNSPCQANTRRSCSPTSMIHATLISICRRVMP
jgi:hypothetical protein